MLLANSCTILHKSFGLLEQCFRIELTNSHNTAAKLTQRTFRRAEPSVLLIDGWSIGFVIGVREPDIMISQRPSAILLKLVQKRFRDWVVLQGCLLLQATI